jgi:hypothetical protein
MSGLLRFVGAVEGEDGTSLYVGVRGDRVEVYAGAWLSADGASFTPEQAEQFAALYARACWEASPSSPAADTHAAIAKSACPQCSAAPGDGCRIPSGKLAAVPHAVRRDAAVAEGFYVPGGAA